MAYTRDGIMAQIWVAFGQGTGAVRVSQDAALELHRWYYNEITDEMVDEIWDKESTAILERIRAIGRLAALHLIGIGGTLITPLVVHTAATTVQLTSDTTYCPTPPSEPTT
jgi:hypothetical protein